jgi:hypothetical protein
LFDPFFCCQGGFDNKAADNEQQSGDDDQDTDHRKTGG